MYAVKQPRPFCSGRLLIQTVANCLLQNMYIWLNDLTVLLEWGSLMLCILLYSCFFFHTECCWFNHTPYQKLDLLVGREGGLKEDCCIWCCCCSLIEKDRLGYWSPEKDCCWWRTFRQPVRKPSSESSVVETSVTNNSPSQEWCFSIKACYSWVQTIFLFSCCCFYC